ncbi:hypothetical protein G6M50_01925 [Agrobacterium rhizogenes]|nr:hypothetical protein [Rhizobium rhizogenes]NTJ76551.1 hypothetical protein [Rhizobium rhizogenes]
MSMGFAVIFQTTLLAFFEEVIKFLIVWFFKRTPYPVIGLFPFAIFEGTLQFSGVSQHLTHLGVNSALMSVALAAYFLLFTKFFHAATSYVYLKSDMPVAALIYCTLWHSASNLLPLPTLSLKYYLLLPVWGLLSSLAAVAIFLLLQRLLARPASPYVASSEDRR